MRLSAALSDTIAPDKGTTHWGTFRDSKRAPVHDWFSYPAGFSWKAVKHSLAESNIGKKMTVYDPFSGIGTVSLVAKQMGIESVGTESHPFICQAANVKLNWNLCQNSTKKSAKKIADTALKESKFIDMEYISEQMPPLILKCYEPKTLRELVALRDALNSGDFEDSRNFLELALTGILRPMSIADTGWPYISLKKIKKCPNNGITATDAFLLRVDKMLNDIRAVKTFHPGSEETRAEIYCSDARESGIVKDGSVDHIFTSPPYLNNIDYADRTRLEMFFWNLASTWGELTHLVRNKLIVAATTQVSGRRKTRYALSPEFRHDCPHIAECLDESIGKLAELRTQRAGKKDYDCMVGGYFSDIHLVLKNCYRALKSGTRAVFILGDSAPYGVHIPTDTFIGEIGCSIGFADYKLTVLRKRGGRWKSSPHTHGVALRESAVELLKN